MDEPNEKIEVGGRSRVNPQSESVSTILVSEARDTSGDLSIADWQLDATADVLDKQYRLYSWNDQKTATLITANSVLAATIGFLFATVSKDPWALLLSLIALILLAASLALSLSQVIPQGSSGKSGRLPNIRSLRGIACFENWKTYHQACRSMTREEFYRDCNRQIYGMTLNNDKSRKKTQSGVRMTLIAIGVIILAALKVSVPLLPFFATTASNAPTTVVSEQPASNVVNEAPAQAATPVKEAKEQLPLHLTEESTSINSATPKDTDNSASVLDSEIE